MVAWAAPPQAAFSSEGLGERIGFIRVERPDKLEERTPHGGCNLIVAHAGFAARRSADSGAEGVQNFV